MDHLHKRINFGGDDRAFEEKRDLYLETAAGVWVHGAIDERDRHIVCVAGVPDATAELELTARSAVNVWKRVKVPHQLANEAGHNMRNGCKPVVGSSRSNATE